MEFASSTGEQEYAAVVRAADDLVVGLDFDGTLSPIVDDPEQAHIHPDAGEVLADLAAQVRAVAVVTGRPARQALDLGGLEEVGNAIGESGRELFVLGQYGNERWTSTDRRVISPKPPRGLATFMGGLPRLLREGDAAGAWVEEKGLAVAVHTRRLDDPQAAFERLLPVLTEAAQQPRTRGRARARGDRGAGARDAQGRGGADRWSRSSGRRAFVFCGDDLGDLEAFKAVEELRGKEFPGLLVCSGSEEQSALAELADVVVDGPGGVLELLRELTEDIRSARA